MMAQIKGSAIDLNLMYPTRITHYEQILDKPSTRYRQPCHNGGKSKGDVEFKRYRAV
jgi:hypothetical protein